MAIQDNCESCRTNVESRLSTVETEVRLLHKSIDELKAMIQSLGADIRANFVPRLEVEQRFRSLEAEMQALKNRPTVPPWLPVAVGVVGAVTGGFITVLVYLATSH